MMVTMPANYFEGLEDVDGWCYLRAVRPGPYKEKMWEDMCQVTTGGFNPGLFDCYAWYSRYPGEMDGRKFSLQFGVKSLGDCGDRIYLQAHLALCGDGMRVRELLSITVPGARLGANVGSTIVAQDVSTEVHAVGPRVQAEATAILAGGPVLRRRFQWSFTLVIGAGEPNYAVVNPTTIARVVMVAKMFESVRLVGCAATLSVSPQLDTVVGVAFGTQGFGPADMGALRARPHSMLCYGKNDGWHRHLWDLPERNQFGKEYKMMNPGNKVGHFTVKLQGPSLAQVDVDGYFDIEFAGEGVMDPIRLKPSSYSDKVTKAARALVPTETPRFAPTDVASESESESEAEAPPELPPVKHDTPPRVLPGRK